MALRSTKQLRWTVLIWPSLLTTARMEDGDRCDDGDFKGTVKWDRRGVQITSIGRYLVSTCDGNVNTIFNRTFERYRLRKNWRFSKICCCKKSFSGVPISCPKLYKLMSWLSCLSWFLYYICPIPAALSWLSSPDSSVLAVRSCQSCPGWPVQEVLL